MGERSRTKIQVGLETTRGTAVAGDKMWLAGEAPPIPPDRIPTAIEDNAGVNAKSVRDAPRIDKFQVTDSITFPDAYFQLLPDLLSMAIKGSITPVEQNPAEADWLWTFTPSMTAANSPDTFTIERGDDSAVFECEFSMISRIRFFGTISQDATPSPFGVEIDYFARQWTKSGFTGSIAIPATETINAKVVRFFKDSTFANLGTTEKTGLLRAFDIEILTGNHPKDHAGADKFFDTFGEGFFEIKADLTIEGNADAVVISDEFEIGTKAFIQFDVSGAQIGAGDNHNLTIGLGGFWGPVTRLSENADGNNLYQAMLNGTYDRVGAQIFTAIVTTDVAAI